MPLFVFGVSSEQRARSGRELVMRWVDWIVPKDRLKNAGDYLGWRISPGIAEGEPHDKGEALFDVVRVELWTLVDPRTKEITHKLTPVGHHFWVAARHLEALDKDGEELLREARAAEKLVKLAP